MAPSAPPLADEDCPSEDALVEFVSGCGDETTMEAIERHLDRCPRCSETVALFGGAFADNSGDELQEPEPEPEDSEHEGLAPDGPEHSWAPSRSGSPRYADRYALGECVGFGAGGVVYRARDLELDRDVALKVLRNEDEIPRGSSSARWRREAKIMARVVHPNVVTVHDVGFFDGRMFIATEFVEGGTLQQWLEQEPRSWREILQVFVEAARGLAAIHACGLVHRDFKPHNVMMGRDGRVRVTDFGLARLLPEVEPVIPESRVSIDAVESTSLSETLSSYTRTGTLVGTPAYMSPEQWRGIPATPRSDQFSLCVALYEALFAQRPWTGRSASMLANNVCETPPARPPARRAPSWLTRAVLRGLSRHPSDRFEDMTAFITTVERAPRRRRQWALGLALVGGFSAVAGGGYGLAHVEEHEPCPAKLRRFAGIWDDPTRARITEALDPALGMQVTEALDPWKSTWLEHDQQACRMQVAQEIGERQHHLTTACLDRALARLSAVTEVLQVTEVTDPEALREILGVLRTPESCADRTHLEALQPAWSSVEAERLALALAPDFERVRVLHAAGRLDEALERAEAAAARADAQGDPALRAEALVTLGHVLTKRKDEARAAEVLKDAVWAAEAGGNVEQAAWGWIELISVLPLLGRFDEAEAAVERAGAVVHRLGDPNARLVFAANRAVLASMRGRYAEALEQHRQILEEGTAIWGPDDPQVTRTHVNVAAALHHLGRLDEAIDHMQVALTQHQQRYRGAHPMTVPMLSNLGVFQFKQGDIPVARATFERSLAMAEELFGPTNPHMISILTNLAQIDYAEGDLDNALRRSEQILEVQRQRYGEVHPDVALAIHNLAGVHAKAGRLEQAEAQFREALALRRQTQGERHPGTAVTMHTLGRVLVLQERWDDAAELLEPALEIRQEAEDDPVRRAATAYQLGRARVGQGRPQQARVLGRQAVELLESIQPRHAAMLGEVKDWLDTID
ncbi:MAG: serine/threonine-protein kinase [Myxococcota bacterium]